MLTNRRMWSAEHLYQTLAVREHLPFPPTMQLLTQRTQRAAQFPPLTEHVAS